MADRLRVTELDFDTIKQNLKTFLQQQTQFTDYNFEGSGLSILLDILAYNTHYNAYYVNMIANESFLDTAILRDSVVSHAKSLGYTGYSSTSPIAIINLTAQSTTNTPGTLTLPAGYSFMSNLIDGKSYNFVVLTDTTVTKSNTAYYFENLQIHEGRYATYNFTQDNTSNPKQIFTFPDTNVDTKTITVSVRQSSSNTSTQVYQEVKDVLDVSSTSLVYFLQESKSGYYQIYFGNDSVGASIPDGAIVTVSYILTSGINSNGANNFVAGATVTDSNLENINNFIINPISAAAGGSDVETVDSIKFSTTSQFSTQNRLVNYNDYLSYIQQHYPGIDSLSVWGGETQVPPVYGKVFISLKPKSGYYISETEKQRIIDELISPKAIITTEAEIIDPQYLYILLNNYVEYDPRKTILSQDQLTTSVKNAVISYNTTYLNNFTSSFVLSKFQDSIDSIDLNAIKGSEVTLKLQKRFLPTLGKSTNYTVDFAAPLHRGTTTDNMVSTQFGVFDSSGILRNSQIEEIPESFTGIDSFNIINPGFGYTSAPTITITGDGTGANAEAVIVNGLIQSINVIDSGINYTRAQISITGGNGFGGDAVAVLDQKVGKLRLIYYDTNAQKQVINDNIGTINYDTGLIQINSLTVSTINTTDDMIRLTVLSDKGIVDSIRQTIITIDINDPSAITTELVQI